MYFASRMQAGRMLAGQLVSKYRYENCAVIALNDGGVVVGAQIAAQLHCVLTMLAVKEINLPRELEAIGAIAQDGSFAYNSDLSTMEVQELESEYYHYIEQEKFNRLQELHQLIGAGGVIKRDLIAGHNVILVSDGLKSGAGLDLAMMYLKPIKTEKIIVATPLASVKAVDRMHILADEIQCLNVVETLPDVDHYYDKQDVPEHTKIIETIENIILQWQ